MYQLVTKFTKNNQTIAIIRLDKRLIKNAEYIIDTDFLEMARQSFHPADVEEIEDNLRAIYEQFPGVHKFILINKNTCKPPRSRDMVGSVACVEKMARTIQADNSV